MEWAQQSNDKFRELHPGFADRENLRSGVEIVANTSQMLRRHGKLSFSSDQIAQIPSMSDAADVLDSKWKHFIILESYKRWPSKPTTPPLPVWFLY